MVSIFQALIKLDQLEVQLTTGDLGLSCSQLAQLHLNISRSLDEVTQQSLEQGYKLLEEVPAAEVCLKNTSLFIKFLWLP